MTYKRIPVKLTEGQIEYLRALVHAASDNSGEIYQMLILSSLNETLDKARRVKA